MTERHSDDYLDGLNVEQSVLRGAHADDGPADDRSVAVAHVGDDLYVSALLDTLAERRSSVDRAEADLLALVMEFADACPSDSDRAGPL